MSRGRRWAASICVFAAAAALYALILLFTGGFEAELLGTRIRSRGWERPAALSLFLLLLAMTVALRSGPGAAEVWARVDSASTARWLTVLGIGWALFAGVRFATHAAGGADSFGYISQAHLLARGALTDTIPMHPQFTWRDAGLSLIPLGYRPAAAPGRMAPVYPPGLPLLMALSVPCGDRIIYGLVPLLGGLVLVCVAAIGRRLGDPLAGAVAAVSLSMSATFLLMQFSPMSDVPVTAMWLGALLSASATFKGAPAVAGVLAGAAVLTRPNLAPLAAVVGALLAAQPGHRGGAMVSFALPFTAATLSLLWIQKSRYGDPFMSGYGEAGDLFAWAYVSQNAVSYAARLTALYTPVIWLWILAPAVARPPTRGLLAATLIVIVAVWVAYLPYLPFEAWFFTRFLLPAIPLMLVLAMTVMLAAVRRMPVWLRPAMTILILLVLSYALFRESRRRGVFEAQAVEQKYPAAGEYVRSRLPANAYVLARQHSGSVRLYASRPTIRWDVIGSDQLDLVVRIVRATGSPVFMVADDEELPAFEKQFEGQATPARLQALARFGQARVYAVE